MTIQQEAQNLISTMSDESVMFLMEVIRHLSPEFTDNGVKKNNCGSRFGMGKGTITDPEDFDKWDKEIEALFYGENE